MQLHLSTWQEVEAYLEQSKTIIIPVGSTEQHGPNGLIGTDAICPEVIAKGIGDETGMLVGPTLNVGIAQHHLGFAGSMAIRPSTMIQIVKDWTDSLRLHGFERFYFLNGHGGNIATLMACFAELHGERSLDGGALSNRAGIKCKLRNWWQGSRVQAISNKEYGSAEGSHATPSEVSVTYAAYPEAVKDVAMDPAIAPRGSFTDSEDYRRTFPDGRIGSNPGLATVEVGHELIKAAIADTIDDLNGFKG